MSAHTHPRTRSQAPSGGVGVRLPWWSIALPALAFGVLLLLMSGPGQAHAATDDPAVGRILEHIHLTLAR
ncbi:hypothetical protein [Streptomyces corynorhini]|uniref:Uncharacterized protein n=1 Tax=Streptomyces corynorhini TaxID=2282652 RepID=A0A370BH79_9ACTN|nr:hypothetical protein [Streptomyces corynorhini]RDG39679.1 hypothetical protein DVH02_02535 [Streptomyces corynorhini]